MTREIISAVLENVFKYLVEGIGVAVAVYLVSGQRYGLRETGMIGLSAALTLMLLDMYAPAVSVGTRHGTGFGLGFKMVNLPALGVEGFKSDESQSNEEGESKQGDESSHYGQNCTCQQPCAQSCQAEDKCNMSCESQPCRIEGSNNLAQANCSYKMIDGYYSKALLPGYNECVKPYNS